MLSRRRKFRTVVSAKLGSLGPNRPENEIWNCVLSCGHTTWRPAIPRGEVFPRMPPKQLFCDVAGCEPKEAT